MNAINAPKGYAPTVPGALQLGTPALLNSEKVDTVAAWVIDGVDDISVEASAGAGTWPTSLVLTLELSLTGAKWFGVPAGSVTYTAASLSIPIDVRTYRFARLRISTKSSAGHGDVTVCIAGR